MTSTAEFSQLLDQFTTAYEEMAALTKARTQEPGLTPVLIDPSDEEIIIAHLKYEDAWHAVSKAADTLWVRKPGT